ncbi:hypothetical protein HAX54_045551, partial [Datura stramonium]|nr:hypothetical protein [Datura stramonium]
EDEGLVVVAIRGLVVRWGALVREEDGGGEGWLSPEKWGEGEEGEAAGDKGEDALEGWWVGCRRGGVSGGLAARGATGGCLWLLAGEREKGEEVGRSGGLVFGWDDWCCCSPAMAAGNN